jgi:hypothetical protein
VFEIENWAPKISAKKNAQTSKVIRLIINVDVCRVMVCASVDVCRVMVCAFVVVLVVVV